MSGWGDWLEKGKALAATIDQQINESVGVEAPSATDGAATDDLNDAWNEDFDDDILNNDSQQQEAEISPSNGWNNEEEEEEVIMENFQAAPAKEPLFSSALPPPVENESIMSFLSTEPLKKEFQEQMMEHVQEKECTTITNDHSASPLVPQQEPLDQHKGWDDDLHVDSHDLEEETDTREEESSKEYPNEEPQLGLGKEPQQHDTEFQASIVEPPDIVESPEPPTIDPPEVTEEPPQSPVADEVSESVPIVPELHSAKTPEIRPFLDKQVEEKSVQLIETVVDIPPKEATVSEETTRAVIMTGESAIEEGFATDESFAMQSQAAVDAKVLQLQEESQMAVALLQSQLEDLQIQLGQREDQLTSKAEQLTTIQAMFESEKEELRKKIADTKEEAKRRILKAKERVEAMEKRLANASKSADEAGAQGELIATLREEGEKLARKQSEMEKAVRAAKSETRDLREHLEAETASKDKALEKIASLEAELKISKEDLATARKGESQVVKLDAELLSVKEECERKAATNLSLEQQVKELKAENKELRTEVEQARRGAELEKQDESKKLKKEHNDLLSDLEDKLRTSEREASLREDALRHEVAEIRKRWQDAVRRADGKRLMLSWLLYVF